MTPELDTIGLWTIINVLITIQQYQYNMQSKMLQTSVHCDFAFIYFNIWCLILPITDTQEARQINCPRWQSMVDDKFVSFMIVPGRCPLSRSSPHQLDLTKWPGRICGTSAANVETRSIFQLQIRARAAAINNYTVATWGHCGPHKYRILLFNASIDRTSKIIEMVCQMAHA